MVYEKINFHGIPALKKLFRYGLKHGRISYNSLSRIQEITIFGILEEFIINCMDAGIQFYDAQ